MTASIVFFYKDRVYYGEIQSGQKFSIGSGKKEDIFIDDSVQVTLKWKKRRRSSICDRQDRSKCRKSGGAYEPAYGVG